MHRVKTVEVAGHVIGANGPAADAFVRLEPVEGNDSGFDRQDSTDERGSFRLGNIPEGSYFITVYKKGEGSRVCESRTRQKIEVSGDNIDSLTISLGGGATIQGRVKVDGPSSVVLDRILVSLMPVDEEGQLGGHSEVKKDETFEMTSVQDANYAVSVWGLEHDAYVKSVRCGPEDVLEKGLQVEGNSPGKIEVIISSNSAGLEGSVSDDDGVVIGAQVAETVAEAKQELESDVQRESASNPSRRLDALRMALYSLDKLELHVNRSRRILNDLRTLRRLLFEERGRTSATQSATAQHARHVGSLSGDTQSGAALQKSLAA